MYEPHLGVALQAGGVVHERQRSETAITEETRGRDGVRLVCFHCHCGVDDYRLGHSSRRHLDTARTRIEEQVLTHGQIRHVGKEPLTVNPDVDRRGIRGKVRHADPSRSEQKGGEECERSERQ